MQSPTEITLDFEYQIDKFFRLKKLNKTIPSWKKSLKKQIEDEMDKAWAEIEKLQSSENIIPTYLTRSV